MNDMYNFQGMAWFSRYIHVVVLNLQLDLATCSASDLSDGCQIDVVSGSKSFSDTDCILTLSYYFIDCVGSLIPTRSLLF